MKKVIHFMILSLSLYFYGNAFASLSDQEKIDIIREQAEPSDTKQTFYKWVPKRDRDNILSDGKITLEIYKYFTRFKVHFSLAGPGIYAYASPPTLGDLLEGEILIQLETQPGYRRLFLSRKTLQSLEEKEVTLEDIFRLQSNVALLSSQGNVVLKGPEGVKITPFNGEGVALSELSNLAVAELSEEQKRGLFNSIKEEIQKRAEKYIALLDPQRQISEEELSRELYKLAGEVPDLLPDEPLFVDVGNEFFFFHEILSIETLKTIIKYMVSKDNYRYVLQVFSNSPFTDHLSSSDKLTVVENMKQKIDTIDTAEKAISFLTAFTMVGDHNLSKTDVSRLVDVPLLSIQEGIELLKDTSYSSYYEHFIKEKAPTLKELAKDIERTFGFNLLNSGSESTMLDTLREIAKNTENRMLERALREFRLEVLSPGITQKLVSRGFGKNYTLSSEDRKKIINKMLQLAQSEHELHSWPLFPDERERAITKFRGLQCQNSLKKK